MSQNQVYIVIINYDWCKKNKNVMLSEPNYIWIGINIECYIRTIIYLNG